MLLLLWILGLSLVALGSRQGTLADMLLTKGLFSDLILAGRRVIGLAGSRQFDHPGIYIQEPTSSVPFPSVPCPTGDQILAEFRSFRDNPPPIDAVLDVLAPKWATSATVKAGKTGRCSVEQAEEARLAYRYQLGRIDARLRALARDIAVDVKAIVIDMSWLTTDFQKPQPDIKSSNRTPLILPLEAQDWMLRERLRLKQEAQARALVGAFLLLAVLGAFGSLIFLIRDFITADGEKTLGDYVFRPVLGVFLAVAVFIVDLMAHSIVSTASVLDVRYEPLYILALGAGLLSERAYDLVRARVDSAFAQYQEAARRPGQATSEGEPNTPLQPPGSALR